MGFEVWIAIVLVASGLSGWIGYAYARKGAPAQSELDALATELDEARHKSERVQTNVNEHFEQSALLFGKLAADYREFLDHFSDSAQSLGLSESRARELIEQGFQPLLTHEDVTDEDAEQAFEGEEVALEAAAVADVTVEMPEDAPEIDPVAVADTAVSDTAAADTATQDPAATDSETAKSGGDISADSENRRASS